MSVLTAYAIFVGVMLSSAAVVGQEVQFALTEEASIGTLVGNLSLVAPSAANGKRQIFKIISGDKSVLSRFKIQGDGLLVGRRIDRDAICVAVKIEECHVRLLISCGAKCDPFWTSILIRDVNDNVPTWVTGKQIVVVHFKDESPPWTALELPALVDADFDVNGTVQDISYSKAPFRIEGKAANLKIRATEKLDREVTSHYALQIVARDFGAPERTATLAVNVVIDDINDNTPKFTQSLYASRAISEGTPSGTVILRVNATDADDSHNGLIRLRAQSVLSDADALTFFGVAKNGAVFVKKRIDVDTRMSNVFNFQIVAEDMAPISVRRSATAMVTIEVTDENDESPEIRFKPYAYASNKIDAMVNENSEHGTIIGILTVTDPDYNGKDEITCGVNDPKFNIEKLKSDDANYKLVLRGSLDRETLDRYKLIITCSDSVKHMKTLDVTVEIGDANDNKPLFSSEQTILYLKENQAVPPERKLKGLIKVTDKDIGNNAKITFTLSQDNLNSFRINSSTGEIFALESFDRETYRQVSLRVVATDGGLPELTSTGTVLVRILDENDNPPVFDQINSDYHFQVKENSPSGEFVGKVAATDRDEGANSNIYYLFDRNTRSDILRRFRVERGSGKIYTKLGLDRELRESYIFTMIARDRGRPPLSSSCRVVVAVEDVNDCTPQILFDGMAKERGVVSLWLKETAGHTIVKLNYSDNDQPLSRNADVSFRLKNEKRLGGYFRIDAKSGLVYLAKNLDNISKRLYRLVVVACDHGEPKSRCSKEFLLDVQLEGSSSDGKLEPRTPHEEKAESGSISPLIVICLSVLFVVLLLTTVVLVCIIKFSAIKRFAHHRFSCFGGGTSGKPSKRDENVRRYANDGGVESQQQTHDQKKSRQFLLRGGTRSSVPEKSYSTLSKTSTGTGTLGGYNQPTAVSSRVDQYQTLSAPKSGSDYADSMHDRYGPNIMHNYYDVRIDERRSNSLSTPSVAFHKSPDSRTVDTRICGTSYGKASFV